MLYAVDWVTQKSWTQPPEFLYRIGGEEAKTRSARRRFILNAFSVRSVSNLLGHNARRGMSRVHQGDVWGRSTRQCRLDERVVRTAKHQYISIGESAREGLLQIDFGNF